MSSSLGAARSQGLQAPSSKIATTLYDHAVSPLYLPNFDSGDVTPSKCDVCNIWCADIDAILLHYHNHHDVPTSKSCLCSRCSAVFSQPTTSAVPGAVEVLSDGHQQLQSYTVLPEGSAGDELAFIPEDADIWEDNLPAFMGKIEAGTFTIDETNSSKEWVIKRKRGKPLTDLNGHPILSISTGRQLRDLPFLPTHIPINVSPWRMLYWDRKAAEQGIRLTNHDLVDRMSFPTKTTTNANTHDEETGILTPAQSSQKANMLSMRVQRYTLPLGPLAMFEKSKSAFPSEQSMRSLEGFYVLQGMLNTWWLPTNMSRYGPWEVVQPQSHPGYRYTTDLRADEMGARTNYQGVSYFVEEMFGLSERVKEVADGLLFLEMKAEQAGVVGREGMWEMLGGLRIGGVKKKGNEDVWFMEEFERWRRGGEEEGPSIDEIRRALESAPSQDVVDAIMGGDLSSVAVSWDEEERR